MQVSRITCRRWASSAAGGVSISGAIDGAVGSATTVPGLISAQMCSRAAARTARARVGLRLRDGRCDLHAFGDAGAELRLLVFDEAAVHLPDLVGLDHAHRFAPLIEPAGREPHVFGLRQIVLHPVERGAQQLDDRLVGFGEAVVGDQQVADRGALRPRRRAAPRRRGGTRRGRWRTSRWCRTTAPCPCSPWCRRGRGWCGCHRGRRTTPGCAPSRRCRSRARSRRRPRRWRRPSRSTSRRECGRARAGWPACRSAR